MFPRPHVGESLVPSSTRVFKDLDFLPQMEEAKFPHKFGAVWTTNDENPGYVHDLEGLAPDYNVDIRFEERKQEGMEDRNYTYHVDRGKFDLMLLKHAQKLGATVYDGVKVGRVDFGPEQPEVYFNIGPKEMSVSCKMVVDCSGRQTFLGNQLKLKVKDTVFDQYAIHSWFDGYDRKVFAKRDTNLDYIYIHFLPISNTWIWQIPITDTVTSLGVVTQKKNFAKSKEDREKFFWETVGSRPLIAETLRKSDRIRPFKEEGDYSYAMKQLAGDRFMLVGDAGRFVDPIFSTGVSIALNSSRFAHKDILSAIEKNDFSRAQFCRLRDEAAPRNQELVRIHLGVLPVERAVHLLHQRQELPAGRSQASSGRRVRRGSARSADQDEADGFEGRAEREAPVAQAAGGFDLRRVPSAAGLEVRFVGYVREVRLFDRTSFVFGVSCHAVFLASASKSIKRHDVAHEPQFRRCVRSPRWSALAWSGGSATVGRSLVAPISVDGIWKIEA